MCELHYSREEFKLDINLKDSAGKTGLNYALEIIGNDEQKKLDFKEIISEYIKLTPEENFYPITIINNKNCSDQVSCCVLLNFLIVKFLKFYNY